MSLLGNEAFFARKKFDFERMYVEHTPKETTQTIFGYSVQNEVFAVHKILYNLRITVFKSD